MTQVPLEPLDPKVILALPEFKVLRGTPGLPEMWVPLELKEFRGRRVLPALRAILAWLGQQVLKAIRVILVRLGLKEFKDPPVRLVPKVPPVPMVLLGLREIQVRRETPELLGLWEQLEQPDQLDLRVILAT